MKTALERTGIRAAIQIANCALPPFICKLVCSVEHVFCQNIRKTLVFCWPIKIVCFYSAVAITVYL